VADAMSAAQEFEEFCTRHPRAAGDIIYMLEVYKTCDRHERVNGRRPKFEEVYTHIFGSANQPHCERCNPAFYREKQILGAPIQR
jgi:hypothetical protein